MSALSFVICGRFGSSSSSVERSYPRGCRSSICRRFGFGPLSHHENAQLLQDIFEEYHKISGLELNIKKTVLVPLFPHTPLDLRAQFHERAPLWGQIGIENAAKYLGLFIGPGSSSLSWHAPMRKYLDRAKVWAGREWACATLSTLTRSLSFGSSPSSAAH